MRRRKLIGLSIGGLAALAGGGAGWLSYGIHTAEHPHFTTLAQVRAWLQGLEVEALRSTGAWSPSQVLNHCAQSLEYSLRGFPEPKPRWFQATLGTTAFRFFRSTGGMKHNLAEPVPGSSLSDLDSDLPAAIVRLHAAMDAFEDPSNVVEPHFAYGELDREDLGAAHAMHISEHLSELATT